MPGRGRIALRRSTHLPKRCVVSKTHAGVLLVVLAAGCAESGANDDSPVEPEPMVLPSGVPTGPQTSATVGPEGGTVESADGLLTLTFPKGALAQPTTIGIQPITNTAPGGIAGAYRLTPSGTTFANPVQLTFAIDAADQQGAVAETITIGFQDDDHYWWAVPEADVQREFDAGTISVSTTHFSDWSWLVGLQLRPPSATLRQGESLMLTAVDCQMHGGDDDNLPQLLALCSIDQENPPLPGIVQEWAVDGIPGGSEAVGTITAGDRPDQAIYTAPDFAVGLERHAVSAKRRLRSGEVVLLVANVTVTGAFTFEISGFFSDPQSTQACSLVASAVNDRVDVTIAPNDRGDYNVEEITNTTTTFTLGSLPPGDPGTFKLDTPPEHITATNGSVVHVQGSDALAVSLFGSGLLGGCTYSFDDVSIPINAMPTESSTSVGFKISDLVDGSLVLAEDAKWSWTITMIE